MTQECVGMLDWGIGGLGCYRLLREKRPSLPVIYWSDAGAVPYGKLGRRELCARVQGVLDALVQRGATRLVVACNAASTVLSEVRTEVPCDGVIRPAIDMVPRQLSGTLAVLGGVRTVRSGIYQRALSTRTRRVVGRVAQPLSAHIEAGTTHTAAFAEVLENIMSPIANADALLLACTHYPAVAAAIRARAPGARVFDPAEALVEAALARLADDDGAGTTRFLTTGDPENMRRAAAQAWGLSLPHIERVTDFLPAPRLASRLARAGT